MGTPDTIYLDTPIKCTICGTLIDNVQSHQFADIMLYYFVGDVLEGSIISGVLEEEVFCPNYQKHPEQRPITPQVVYLAIWHHILISVEETHDIALKKVQTFGQGELYLLYEGMQKRRNEYRNNFNRLRNIVQTYASYLELPNSEQTKILAEDADLTTFFYHGIAKYLKEKSPLKAILLEIEKDRGMQ